MKKVLLFLTILISCLAYGEENLLSENFQTQSEQQADPAPIQLTYINGQLTIENAPLNSKVEVFTMLGVSIFHDTTIENKQVFLIDLNKGYYIIKVAGLTKKISVK